MTETLNAADEPAGCGCTCNPHHGLTFTSYPVPAGAGVPMVQTYTFDNKTATAPMALNIGTVGPIGAGFRASVPTYATSHFR